jgi:DNA (cytosine-5)-methyltransferase 1
MKRTLRAIEICAGAGGQSLGLEAAGFSHEALIEIDPHPCSTLRANRPEWNVYESDVKNFSAKRYRYIDLLAGGVPCPPFSIAGKQLGQDDDRDLFPEAMRLVHECRPKALLLENVRGFASAKFQDYRDALIGELASLGYACEWKVLNAASFGVPQLRPRFALIALRKPYANYFHWPEEQDGQMTVADSIEDLLGENGWRGIPSWRGKANRIAPTLVGGSKKHGGPDLGPTRAKKAWAELGINGKGIANEPPDKTFPADGMPKLTNQMAARIQGFPDSWKFSGGKTAVYRQIGNAFPPPVAAALGLAIGSAIEKQLKRESPFGLQPQAPIPGISN